MPLIKRYPNRKLYDTRARRYVTLEEIAALIRDGQDVVVVDHATEEDLTAVTLAQILLGEEKRRGYLPQSLLAGLVRAGGQTFASLRRALDAPLDLVRQVDEEIDRRLTALVQRSELTAEEAARLSTKLVPLPSRSGAPRFEEDRIHAILQARGLADRDEVEALLARLDELSVGLDEILARARRAEGQ
jgi:polyhydroxyalkanoate synthesis repressor PhaR